MREDWLVYYTSQSSLIHSYNHHSYHAHYGARNVDVAVI